MDKVSNKASNKALQSISKLKAQEYVFSLTLRNLKLVLLDVPERPVRTILHNARPEKSSEVEEPICQLLCPQSTRFKKEKTISKGDKKGIGQ